MREALKTKRLYQWYWQCNGVYKWTSYHQRQNNIIFFKDSFSKSDNPTCEYYYLLIIIQHIYVKDSLSPILRLHTRSQNQEWLNGYRHHGKLIFPPVKWALLSFLVDFPKKFMNYVIAIYNPQDCKIQISKAAILSIYLHNIISKRRMCWI